MAVSRRPSLPSPAVAASPTVVGERSLRSRFSDQSLQQTSQQHQQKSHRLNLRSPKSDPKPEVAESDPTRSGLKKDLVVSGTPVINISPNIPPTDDPALADELDYITVESDPLAHIPRADKASRILGVRHRRSMEPIPASNRTSIVSTRSARDAPPSPSFTPTLPLTSLYVVSGLPKSPHTWTLADPDSVLGLHHSDSAVSRWWRPEVLGSTVSPGAGGGGKKKRRGKVEETMKGAGALTKQEVGKMLSKALKVP